MALVRTRGLAMSEVRLRKLSQELPRSLAEYCVENGHTASSAIIKVGNRTYRACIAYASHIPSTFGGTYTKTS